MSDKTLCPACQSYTSNVRGAFTRGEDCPHCGLSATAAAEVMSARERGATAELVERTAQAELRAQKAEAKVAKLRTVLAEISSDAAQALIDA